jgi:hypothetical protein
MKKSIIPLLLLITISSICYGQMWKDTSYFDGCNWTTCKGGTCTTTTLACYTEPLFIEDDSLTQEKYFKFDQRSSNTYLLEYKFNLDEALKAKTDSVHHFHVPAMIKVTWFYWNKKIELATISGVLSSTQCQPPDNADDQERWTNQAISIYSRLFQNNKK